MPLPGPLSHLDGPTLLLFGLYAGLAGACDRYRFFLAALVERPEA